MKIECKKCRQLFSSTCWESGVTYHGIDGHHLHPKVLDNPKGLGEIIDLCRKCHLDKLHPLILDIVKKHSYRNGGKAINWIWKYVPSENILKCIEEVKQFTLNWLKDNDGDTNSKTTAQS